MKSFKEYLMENKDIVIDIDTKQLENNVDSINAELDTYTEKPYRNAPIFLTQLRGALERYGIMLPATATSHFLTLGSELVYMLGDTDKHLYVVFDTNDDGLVDGYAQIVDSDELEDLVGMDKEEMLTRDPNDMTKKPWIPPARKDDDSGDTSEY